MGSPPASQQTSFQKRIAYHLDTAQRDRHRHLVVLSGNQNWAESLIESIQDEFLTGEVLFVSDRVSPFSFETNTIKANKLKQRLGQECNQLIWDGFSGINPDGLGAASGLVKGGGLLFLVVPELDLLVQQPDPDYLRMCGSESELSDCSTYFLQLLVNTIRTDPHVCLIEEQNAIEHNEHTQHEFKNPKPVSLPTQDQKEAIELIKKVAKGRARRPLVITADRGRGKSASLGIAAAELTKEKHISIKITGPSEAACSMALKHFKTECESGTLDFCPPDELIHDRPEADLILVDEAASIPAPILAKILNTYPRIVFASTVHGYEGTGRGFAVRFIKQLDEITPQWKGIEMKEPIRWAEEDPLESFIFNALCLDAEPSEISSLDEVKGSEFTWVTGRDLIKDTRQLKEVFGLLVNAHYQTSPTDLRMILDHPNVVLGLLKANHQTVAVIVLINEGGIEDEPLALGIIRGERKPKNHLVPQALTFATANPKFLALRSLRIMRIATHPNCQRQGIGSTLLAQAEIYASDNGFHFLSSSFGFTTELMAFWSSNQFDLIRVGRHKDSASGTESVIVAKPLCDQASTELCSAKRQFYLHFEASLPSVYRDMEAIHVWEIMRLANQKEEGPYNPLVIESVANGHRSIEESILEIQGLIKAYWKKENPALPDINQNALTIKVLQGRSWKTLVSKLSLKGKAEAEKLIRQSVQIIDKDLVRDAG